jgi:hypothetical protein
LFKSKRSTREELIREVATFLGKEHAEPSDCFGHLTHAEGQPLDNALAEWHALTIATTVYALWGPVGSKEGERISPILDAFRPAFLKCLTPGCREIFLRIATLREEEYVKGIYEALNGRDVVLASHLSGLMGKE